MMNKPLQVVHLIDIFRNMPVLFKTETQADKVSFIVCIIRIICIILILSLIPIIHIRTRFFSKIYNFFLQMTTFFSKPMECSIEFSVRWTERRTGPILS